MLVKFVQHQFLPSISGAKVRLSCATRIDSRAATMPRKNHRYLFHSLRKWHPVSLYVIARVSFLWARYDSRRFEIYNFRKCRVQHLTVCYSLFNQRYKAGTMNFPFLPVDKLYPIHLWKITFFRDTKLYHDAIQYASDRADSCCVSIYW